MKRTLFMLTVFSIVWLAMPLLTGCVTANLIISIDQIKNASIKAPVAQVEVQLTDGKYAGGEMPNYLSVAMADKTAIGDLNGDGRDEAAVLFGENNGGSGDFVSLVVFKEEGVKVVQGPSYYIDDRPVINSLSIEDGLVKLGVTVHGPNDPMVSPTKETIQRFQWEHDQLVLVRYCTFVTADTENKIVIDAPVDQQEVSGLVEITGSMPIAPFENTLALRVVDAAGNILIEQPFMVSAADMGAPATFENTVDLSGLAGGQTVRIELLDLSAADGSIIAMNSVEVVLP
jgi:hypothetical protein